MSRMCRRRAYASAPCDCSSWAVQTWSAETTVQKCLPADPCPGTEHFSVPFGAVQVKGRREEVRVSPQWQSQPAASSTSIKMNLRMLPRLGKDCRSILGQHTVGAQQDCPPSPLDHSANIINQGSCEMLK